jgi:DNA primase
MHKNGDSNPSASLNRETLLFNCFTCGGGSIIWLVQNCLDISRDDAIAELKNFADGVKVVPVEKFLEKLNKLFEEEKRSRVEIPVYNDRILSRWEGVTNYLTDRGISARVQKEMRTGIDLSRTEIARTSGIETYVSLDRVILPHFIEGRLVGWVARKVQNVEGVAKYKNSKGFPRGQWLYNLDNARMHPHLYVVESPMSVLALKSRGIDNVVATFGAKVTESQMELLRPFKRITVFMDGDSAGHKATRDLVRGLRDFTHIEVIDTPDGEDAASLDYVPEPKTSLEWELSGMFS